MNFLNAADVNAVSLSVTITVITLCNPLGTEDINCCSFASEIFAHVYTRLELLNSSLLQYIVCHVEVRNTTESRLKSFVTLACIIRA